MNASYILLSDTSSRAKLHSDAVVVDGWAFISGQQPIDLQNDRVPLPEMIEEQTRKILANLEVLLAPLGASRENVVSVHISLVDFKRIYERMNSVYISFFSAGSLPARTCIGVSALTRGAMVEMNFVVRVPERAR
jgi:2-iminobutanoate/2-iminopropanoate deaminase